MAAAVVGSSSRRRRSALLAVAVVAATLAPVPSPAGAATAPTVDLVVRTAGMSPDQALQLGRAAGVDIRSARRLGGGSVLLRVRAGTGAAAAARTVAAVLPGSTASPDRRITVAGAPAPVHPSAALFNRQWDLWDAASTRRAGGYGIDAPRAWTRTTGSPGVVVAVLDTGITAHPDLAGASLIPGYDFVSGARGVGTGDGDGWDADPSDPGDACAATGEPSSWHGTFVAGEIVAQHTGTGVAGAAPRVSLMPVRVLGRCGGVESDTIAAINWSSGGDVPGVPASPRRADVISVSLGSMEGACSAALQAAIDGAVARGTAIVAAAGNDGADIAAVSPANCRGVITVAASTRSGGLAAYSNRGTGAGVAPTIAAPGGSSADPVLGDGWSSTGDFGAAGDRAGVIAAEGTSMATPRVAAAAALVRSQQPGLAPDRVAARLVATATPFAPGSGCVPRVCGAGIVNLGDAVGAQRRFVLAGTASTSGSARVGHVLTARAGDWRPTPAVLHYQWLRDGRPIAGATRRTYVPAARDAGHRLAVRVQVSRPGTVDATAVSTARRIAR